MPHYAGDNHFLIKDMWYNKQIDELFKYSTEIAHRFINSIKLFMHYNLLYWGALCTVLTMYSVLYEAG